MQIDIDQHSQFASKQLKNEVVFQLISDDFFNKCSDLYQIQRPFSLQQIESQVQSRDTNSQFQLLRALTQTKKHKLRFRINNAIQNKKNRYPEQSIYDHSRVTLPKNKLSKNSQGYINANFIKSIEQNRQSQSTTNKLILTQGPVQNSTDQLIQMVEVQSIQCVVMLCRLVQNGKNRCSDYLSKHKKQLIKSIADDTVQIYKITLNQPKQQHQNNASSSDNQTDPYSFIHIAYSQWPDKSVPSDINHIHELVQQILKFDRIAIHCSAGLGRSGVIAAILMIQKNSQWMNHKNMSVFRQVRKMREYRFGAVQNSQQYAYIYKYFLHLWTNTIKQIQ